MSLWNKHTFKTNGTSKITNQTDKSLTKKTALSNPVSENNKSFIEVLSIKCYGTR